MTSRKHRGKAIDGPLNGYTLSSNCIRLKFDGGFYWLFCESRSHNYVTRKNAVRFTWRWFSYK